MNDFKIGDTVYYMKMPFNFDGTISLSNLKINDGNFDRYEDNLIWLLDGAAIYQISGYKSRQDCIDAFKKRLDEL